MDAPVSLDEIERIARDIAASRMSPGERQQHYGCLYPQFKTEYPAIFEMCCKLKSMRDLKPLLYMLEQKKQMAQTGLSQHDASVKVGTLLFDQYIKPTQTTTKETA